MPVTGLDEVMPQVACERTTGLVLGGEEGKHEGYNFQWKFIREHLCKRV